LLILNTYFIIHPILYVYLNVYLCSYFSLHLAVTGRKYQGPKRNTLRGLLPSVYPFLQDCQICFIYRTYLSLAG